MPASRTSRVARWTRSNGVVEATRKRTVTAGSALAAADSAAVSSSDDLPVPSSRVTVRRRFERDDPGRCLQSGRRAGRARRVDGLREQSRPFPDGDEAVGMLQDLDRAGEDVLLFGPEEAVEDLPAPRELDLEFDPARQVGGDRTRDGVDGPVAIGSEPPRDGPGRIHGDLQGPGRLAVGDERVSALEIRRRDGRTRRRPAGLRPEGPAAVCRSGRAGSCPGPSTPGHPRPGTSSGCRRRIPAVRSGRVSRSNSKPSKRRTSRPRAFQETRSRESTVSNRSRLITATIAGLSCRPQPASEVPMRPATWPGSPGRSSRSPGPHARRARPPAGIRSSARSDAPSHAPRCAAGTSKSSRPRDPAEIVAERRRCRKTRLRGEERQVQEPWDGPAAR